MYYLARLESPVFLDETPNAESIKKLDELLKKADKEVLKPTHGFEQVSLSHYPGRISVFVTKERVRINQQKRISPPERLARRIAGQDASEYETEETIELNPQNPRAFLGEFIDIPVEGGTRRCRFVRAVIMRGENPLIGPATPVKPSIAA